VALTLRTTSGRRKGVMNRFGAFVPYQWNLCGWQFRPLPLSKGIYKAVGVIMSTGNTYH